MFTVNHQTSCISLVKVKTFGEPLEWLRLKDKKSCRIQYSCVVDGYNKDSWSKFVEWHLSNMARLEMALKLAAVALRNKNFE